MNYLIKSNQGNDANQQTWWIDKDTYLIFQSSKFDEAGGKIIDWYKYNSMNEPLAETDFFPPVHHRYFLKPEFEKPLNEDFDTRFIEIDDGSGGEIRARWGRSELKGKESTGL